MAIRYTKQQKASPYFELYKKERARLQNFARSAKARGIELPEDFIPKVPKNIRAGSVRKLQRITPEHGYYERAEYMRVNPESGEIVFKKGSQTAISRGISEVKTRQEKGERWVTAREAKDELDFRRWRNEVESTDYTEPEEPDYQFRPDLSDTTPEPIDTTPQDEIDDSGDYWYEDTYEPDDSDYEDNDSDFDEAFDSDYIGEYDRIDWDRQIERTQEQIDNTIDYIGNNVSGHMADAVRDVIDKFKASNSDEGWAVIMDDEDFWNDIASLVEDHYKNKKDPMPEVINRINSKLTGRPMTMEENSKFEDYINSDDSESYDV